MALPSWKELSPLTRRSKKRRYELIREELDAIGDEIQETPEPPEIPEDNEDDEEEEDDDGDEEEG